MKFKASFAALLAIGLLGGPALADKPEGTAVGTPSNTTLPRVAPKEGRANFLIYEVSGVTDSGGGTNAGVATTFHCSNLSTASQTVQFIIMQWNGATLKNIQFTLASGRTLTVSTHSTRAFVEDASLTPGVAIFEGSAFIGASNVFVQCTAKVISAASVPPTGITLNMRRYNQASGAEE